MLLVHTGRLSGRYLAAPDDFFFPMNIVLNPCFLQGARQGSAESEEGQEAPGKAQEERGESQPWWGSSGGALPLEGLGLASSTQLMPSADGSLKIREIHG